MTGPDPTSGEKPGKEKWIGALARLFSDVAACRTLTAMVFRSRTRREVFDAGTRFRAEHSAWLTLALMSGRRYPRIPAKRADLGGYDRLASTPSGRGHAARWWRTALARIGL